MDVSEEVEHANLGPTGGITKINAQHLEEVDLDGDNQNQLPNGDPESLSVNDGIPENGNSDGQRYAPDNFSNFVDDISENSNGNYTSTDLEFKESVIEEGEDCVGDSDEEPSKSPGMGVASENIARGLTIDGDVEGSFVLNGSETTKREVSRCSRCRRKVGLTGFQCRCGDLCRRKQAIGSVFGRV